MSNKIKGKIAGLIMAGVVAFSVGAVNLTQINAQSANKHKTVNMDSGVKKENSVNKKKKLNNVNKSSFKDKKTIALFPNKSQSEVTNKDIRYAKKVLKQHKRSVVTIGKNFAICYSDKYLEGK